LTVAILTLSDKRLIETDLLKTDFLFEFSSFPCTFDRCLEPVLMIQQSYNGRQSCPYEKRSATTLQKSELSKHYRCLHPLKSWKAIKKKKNPYPNLEDHAIGNTHIFFFGLSICTHIGREL
jgi:hypothetical protein